MSGRCAGRYGAGPLIRASPLARLVASLGVMLHLVSVTSLRFGAQGSTTLVIDGILPDHLVRFGDDVAIYADRLWLAAIALAAAGALYVVSRRTRFGLATRAVFNWEWFTGGVEGSIVPPAKFLGIDLDIAALGSDYPRREFGLMIVIVAAALLLLAVRFGRSATVKRWIAVRGNERAAVASAVSVRSVKVTAFACSAFLAGLAGSLTAYQRQTLSIRSFDSFGSIVALSIAYLAGIATPLGALVAGALATGGVLTVALGQDASRYQFAVNGVMLVLAAILLPEGIVGRLTRRRTADGSSSRRRGR